MSRAQNVRRWAVVGLTGLVLVGLVGVPARKRGWPYRRPRVRPAPGNGGPGGSQPHRRTQRSVTLAGKAKWGVCLSWLVVWVAVMTSVIEASLTSVSFLERFSPFISRWEDLVVLVVIVVAAALTLITIRRPPASTLAAHRPERPAHTAHRSACTHDHIDRGGTHE